MAKFTIITGGAAPSATPKTVPVPGGSPSKSRQNQNFGGLATAFKALSPRRKAGWQAAANALNAAQGRVGRRRLTAANTFHLRQHVSPVCKRAACAGTKPAGGRADGHGASAAVVSAAHPGGSILLRGAVHAHPQSAS